MDKTACVEKDVTVAGGPPASLLRSTGGSAGEEEDLVEDLGGEAVEHDERGEGAVC
jgi:hypothetical protein